MRQLAATALLAGNGVLLFLGVSDLIFVVSGWVSQFGARSEAVFGTVAGPVAIALPLVAVLIATHVSPALPHSRPILITALVQYAVSALFGVITYLGGFAYGVFSVRSTFNWLLGRAVWLAFLTIAITVVYRVFREMYPPAPAYRYGPTVYGRPYPGQPSYPRPTYGPAPSDLRYDAPPEVPTSETSAVPPRAAAPPAGSPPPDATVRVPPPPAGSPPPDATVRVPPAAAEATRQMPPVAGSGAPEA